MTVTEPAIDDRVEESPKFSLAQMREVPPRDIAVRFAAGAFASILAGIVTLIAGARAGGIFLAFPAILAASLTLIEQEEDSEDAREDARGAVMGGAALAAFAAVGALAFTHLAAGIVIALATIVWLVVAIGGYAIAWFRPARG